MRTIRYFTGLLVLLVAPEAGLAQVKDATGGVVPLKASAVSEHLLLEGNLSLVLIHPGLRLDGVLDIRLDNELDLGLGLTVSHGTIRPRRLLD